MIFRWFPLFVSTFFPWSLLITIRSRMFQWFPMFLTLSLSFPTLSLFQHLEILVNYFLTNALWLSRKQIKTEQKNHDAMRARNNTCPSWKLNTSKRRENLKFEQLTRPETFRKNMAYNAWEIRLRSKRKHISWYNTGRAMHEHSFMRLSTGRRTMQSSSIQWTIVFIVYTENVIAYIENRNSYLLLQHSWFLYFIRFAENPYIMFEFFKHKNEMKYEDIPIQIIIWTIVIWFLCFWNRCASDFKSSY